MSEPKDRTKVYAASASFSSLVSAPSGMEFKAPEGQTFKMPDHSASTLQINSSNGVMVVIKPDGTLEYGKDYTPDEAAKIFWQSVAAYFPTRKPRELNAWKVATKLYDSFWARNGGNSIAFEKQAEAIRHMWFHIAQDAIDMDAAPE